jgi:hypothetical protein
MGLDAEGNGSTKIVNRAGRLSTYNDQANEPKPDACRRSRPVATTTAVVLDAATFFEAR